MQAQSWKLISYFRSSEQVVLTLCLFYYILMAFVAPGFFTVANSWNLLFNIIPLLILAIGQTYVMLTAGIDLSIGSIVALTSVSGAYVMSTENGWALNPIMAMILGIALMILVGGMVGWVNGFAVSRLSMPPFMVTLCSMIFFSGFAIWLTASQNIYNLPDAFVDLPYTRLLGIPIPLLIGILVAAIALFLLNKTVRGAWIYAIGLNPKAAKISGVRVNSTIRFVYIFCGCCAAIASVLYTSRLETGSPVMGQHILLDVIGAVVIGGTSLFGGKGRIQWTIYGVLLIVMIDNSLNLMGLSYFLIMMVKGSVILGAMLIYVLRDRNANPIA